METTGRDRFPPRWGRHRQGCKPTMQPERRVTNGQTEALFQWVGGPEWFGRP